MMCVGETLQQLHELDQMEQDVHCQKQVDDSWMFVDKMVPAVFGVGILGRSLNMIHEVKSPYEHQISICHFLGTL